MRCFFKKNNFQCLILKTIVCNHISNMTKFICNHMNPLYFFPLKRISLVLQFFIVKVKKRRSRDWPILWSHVAVSAHGLLFHFAIKPRWTREGRNFIAFFSSLLTSFFSSLSLSLSLPNQNPQTHTDTKKIDERERESWKYRAYNYSNNIPILITSQTLILSLSLSLKTLIWCPWGGGYRRSQRLESLKPPPNNKNDTVLKGLKQ